MNFLAELFSANQIIGKTLIAKRPLIAYSLPLDKDVNKKELFKIPTGGTVGIVDTYFSPKNNRSSLWWGFKQGNNFYYVEHAKGNFDITALKKQGTPTTEEEQPKKEEPIEDKIEKYIKYAGIAAIGLIGLNIILKNYIKNK